MTSNQEMPALTLRDIYRFIIDPHNDIEFRFAVFGGVTSGIIGGIIGYIKPYIESVTDDMTAEGVLFKIIFASPFYAARNAFIVGGAGYMSGLVYGNIFKFLFGGKSIGSRSTDSIKE